MTSVHRPPAIRDAAPDGPPRANDVQRPTLVTGIASAQARPDQLRVVLVEDSPADAELLLAMLELELPALDATVAASLQEAHALLTGPVDAVITDLSLPDADGLDALHALRAAVPDTVVLVVTGRRDTDLGMTAILAGADDYVVKGSLDGHALATALQYAVHRRNVGRDRRRFERLALSLLDAMESPTCAVNQAGDIVAINRAWGSFSALRTSPEDVGRSYLALCETATAVDPASRMAICLGLRQVLGGKAPRFQLDYACAVEGETRWFSVRINPLSEGDGAVLTHVDVTVAKRAEQDLAHQTLHDSLTGLPNRELLASQLSRALSSAARHGLSVAVGFVDLDSFKRINDSLGHHAGDELLMAVTERLRGSLRAEDMLARFAGDEFVVVWQDVASAADAEVLAERLRAAFDEPFQLQQASVTATASIGVALGAAPMLPDQLLLAADAAMYDAKSRGRGRTRMFSAELRSGAESRHRVEAEMRQALAIGQFVLDYQPVVDLRLGNVRGVEALVRWAHPDGLRMPDSFIPVAEASGLIVPLGAWVLQEACRQVAAWQREGLTLHLAVNLSVRQISHPDIVATIAEALSASGLDPQRLMLEVTESAMFEDAESAQVTLSRIAELGATIAIDDFGTGYSSLLYLKRYPVQALKVDRTFVSGMGTNKDDHAIVTSVVSLARAVGSACIAEGVETMEQHAALRKMDCDYAQGYLFSRPVAAADLPAAVAACTVQLQDSPDGGGARATAAPPIVEKFVLDRIRQMHSAGASLHTIAAALNREHAPHPDSLRWHSVTVAQVIAGSYRPSPRRRSAALRGSRPPVRPAPRHRSLQYEDLTGLVPRICDPLSAALDASEAVLVVAPESERAAIHEGLLTRGHDLDALALASQYRAWDADDVLRQLTVDGRISERLFRLVVAHRVETALSRFGRARVYGSIAARLWERGDVATALALEEHWEKLVARLPVDLVCGYQRAALDAVGSDADRSCLHAKHAD